VSQAWLTQSERGSIIAIRLLVGAALLLGRPIARLILYPVVMYFLVSGRGSRAASRKYLERVLGRQPRFADLFRHHLTFAAVGLDRVYLLKDRVELFDSQIFGEDVLLEVTRGGQGCFLVGAHLGSFEILRAFGTAKHLRIGLVMYEENVRMVNTVARAINPALAEDVISLGRFDSMLKLAERLQQSDWVGMLGDRALDDEAQLRVPFLGASAAFPTAPFRLALMLKRPIVLMIGLYRGGNRYEMHFEKLFEPGGVSATSRAQALEQAVRLYAQRLEHYCRQAPYNWFNFYDFWNASRAPA
jgi:predicted LPLAT superfamily acyltransferase